VVLVVGAGMQDARCSSGVLVTSVSQEVGSSALYIGGKSDLTSRNPWPGTKRAGAVALETFFTAFIRGGLVMMALGKQLDPQRRHAVAWRCTAAATHAWWGGGADTQLRTDPGRREFRVQHL
jgi:hypothetical protein